MKILIRINPVTKETYICVKIIRLQGFTSGLLHCDIASFILFDPEIQYKYNVPINFA